MTKFSIVRQVIDLQAQAERLIRTGGNMPEIEAFSKHNEEVKSYLLKNISDEFILDYIKTIPEINIEHIKIKSGITSVIIGFFSVGSAVWYHEKLKIKQALKQIKVISHKYSSYQMLIKNYFDS